MKWLIMSDNHGGWTKVNSLIDNYREQVDLIFHCGDSEFPADDPIWKKVDYVVKGNMDFDPQYYNTQMIETDHGKILLVHGHRHGVNAGHETLLQLAQEERLKFVFHGHTHRLYADQYQGVIFINPGSLNHSRGPINEKTFALVEIMENQVKVEFLNDAGIVLHDLTKIFEVNHD